MIINVKRKIFNPNNTISEVYIDGEFFGNILEDTDRGLDSKQPLEEIKKKKVYGETAIPTGTYEVVISWSNRFNQYLPLLVNVPGYDGIRIHPGNTEVDSLGCLLPGKISPDKHKVLQSRITFNKLFSLIKTAAKKEKIFISIESSK